MRKTRKETYLTVNLKLRKTGKAEMDKKPASKQPSSNTVDSKTTVADLRDKLYEDFPEDCFRQPKRKCAPILEKEFKVSKER